MESDNTDDAIRNKRIRNVDWRKVIAELDTLPPKTTVFVGVMDQSTRTHLRKGRVTYLDPDKYHIWTESVEGSRQRCRLYMQQKP